MNVELVAATPDDEPRLNRLVQLYAYDFSELVAMDVGDDGLFHVGHLLSRCWPQPWSHVYFCYVDKQIAGFAILDERSRLTGDVRVMDMAEFFIMRKYRRKGVGARCAVLAFELFPRPWEVRQHASNVPATRFWRAVIDHFTQGRFDETFRDDQHWYGPVQSFDASQAARAAGK